MAYGFELNTADGSTLSISKDYFNLSLFQKANVGALLYMYAIGGGRIFRGTITSSLLYPTLAVELAAGSFVSVYDTTTTSSMFTFDIWVKDGVNVNAISYYVFSAGNVSNKKYGKQVFNDATGACVFDAMLKYMRVLGRGQMNVGANKVAMMAQGRSGYYDRKYVGQSSSQSRYLDSETFNSYARSGNDVVAQSVFIDYGYVLKPYLLPDGMISQRSLPQPLILNVTNF